MPPKSLNNGPTSAAAKHEAWRRRFDFWAIFMGMKWIRTHRRIACDLGDKTLPELLRDFPTPKTAQLEDDYLSATAPHEVTIRRAASKPAHAPVHRIVYHPHTASIDLYGRYPNSALSIFLYATIPLWAMVFNQAWHWSLLLASLGIAAVLLAIQWLTVLDATITLQREIRIRIPHLLHP